MIHLEMLQYVHGLMCRCCCYTYFCVAAKFCFFSNCSTCLCILNYADTWQIAFWKQISGTAVAGTEID